MNPSSTDGCKNPLSSIMYFSINGIVDYIHVHFCVLSFRIYFIHKVWGSLFCQAIFPYITKNTSIILRTSRLSQQNFGKKVVHLIFDMLLYSIAVQLVCPSVICKRSILGAAWDSSLSFGAATLRIFCICRTHGPSSYICKTEETKPLTPLSKHTVISRHTNRCPQAKESVI